MSEKDHPTAYQLAQKAGVPLRSFPIPAGFHYPNGEKTSPREPVENVPFPSRAMTDGEWRKHRTAPRDRHQPRGDDQAACLCDPSYRGAICPRHGREVSE